MATQNDVDPNLWYEEGQGWYSDPDATAALNSSNTTTTGTGALESATGTADTSTDTGLVDSATGTSGTSSSTSTSSTTGWDPNNIDSSLFTPVTVESSSSSFKPSTNYIDAATATVAGQLEGLLDSDSPYITDARRRAAEQSQARGWGGSSMAMGAGETAAIQSALPIATADAGMYADAAANERSYEFQTAENAAQRSHESNVLEAKNEFQAQQDELNRQFNQALQDDNQSHAINLEGISQANRVALEDMQNAQEKMITDMNLTATEKQNLIQGSSAAMRDYTANVQSIMTDPSFLELSGLELEKTMNNFKNMATNQVKFLGSLTQTADIDAFIDAAFPPMTAV